MLTFSRQQSLHLGLSNAIVENTNDQKSGNSTRIIENKQSTNSSMPINQTSVLKYAVPESILSNIQVDASMTKLPVQNNTVFAIENVNANATNPSDVASRNTNNKTEAHRRKRSMSSNSSSYIASQTSKINSRQIILQSINAKAQSNISNITNSTSNDLQKSHDNGKANMNKAMKGAKKNRNDAIMGHITVLIHNISVITNTDKDYSDNLENEGTNPVHG